MKEKALETVSALMDAEEQSKQAVDAVCSADALRQKWSRYHLIGDVLRNTAPECLASCTAAQVHSRLADEAMVFAPKHLGRPKRTRWPYAAMAASVAAVALVSVVQWQSDSQTMPLGIAQQTGQASQQKLATSARPTHTIEKNGHQVTRLTPVKPLQPHLNHYLTRHGAVARSLREADQVRVVTFPK